jgi:hypothetical protein
MATGLERNKHLNRPRKGDADKRHRQKVQRRRLVAMGVPEEKAQRLDSQEIRAMLRHPVKTAKAHAAK